MQERIPFTFQETRRRGIAGLYRRPVRHALGRGATMCALPRLPRVLALSEAPIPSAVLGVHAIGDALAAAGACEFASGSSLAPRPAQLAWAAVVVLLRGAS